MGGYFFISSPKFLFSKNKKLLANSQEFSFSLLFFVSVATGIAFSEESKVNDNTQKKTKQSGTDGDYQRQLQTVEEYVEILSGAEYLHKVF